MLRDFTTLRLSGGNFTSSTVLNFFDTTDGKSNKTIKGTLLYGRNGTGKSTIAKAFRKVSGTDVSGIATATAYDNAGNLLPISDVEKKHIYVFDEDYLDRNVKIQQDHLDSIVILGPAANLTESIQDAETAREEAKNKFKQQEVLFNEYNDFQNPKSTKYCLNAIGNALRGDDNWSGRDKEINGGRHNTPVRDDTYKKFLSSVPSKSKTDLIVDYKEKIKILNDARTGKSITRDIPSISKSFNSYDDIAINTLLQEKIEKPELSEREKHLLLLTQQGKTSELADRLVYLKSKSTKECPYCFQPLSDERKESLIASIQKVLSRDVEEHQNALRRQVYGDILPDAERVLSSFVDLPSYSQCYFLVKKTRQAVQNNNELLDKKIENPFEPINTNLTNVNELVQKLNDSLAELEKEKTEYNNTAKRTRLMIEELTKINSEIAYYDIQEPVAQYEKQKAEYSQVEENFNALKEDYEKKKKTVEELEAQRRNIRLAIDSINACLTYIFFDENRLKIAYENGYYKLYSHGKSVKPCDVSVGERNIIGLSYFFTSIFEGKEEDEAYKEEYVIVIDDPVSSFDTENRIGILSFLKYKISAFLEGNQYTKVLVMTHDLMTFYDIHKILEEIVATCKKQGYKPDPKFNTFELRDNILEPFQYKKRQEYSEILKEIYKYASGENSDDEIVIGNLMRQVLEAFSTFEFRTGIEEVSNNPTILAILPEEYRTYYQNLMYRLVLHGGSHREEQVKAMKDFRFFSLISDDEKKRTARDVLCMIYLFNEPHLLIHLSDDSNRNVVKARLESWCRDIKTRAAVM